VIDRVTDAYLRAVHEALPRLVDALDIPLDRAALRRYNLENLRDYWQPIAAGIRRDLAEEPADAPVDGGDVAWSVLGPARLHYTLAHQDIIAKATTAAYLGRLFPQGGPLAERAVRWRAGNPETFTAADLRAAGHSFDAVAEDARNRWAEQRSPQETRQPAAPRPGRARSAAHHAAVALAADRMGSGHRPHRAVDVVVGELPSEILAALADRGVDLPDVEVVQVP
jgi:hypothetical protein